MYLCNFGEGVCFGRERHEEDREEGCLDGIEVKTIMFDISISDKDIVKEFLSTVDGRVLFAKLFKDNKPTSLIKMGFVVVNDYNKTHLELYIKKITSQKLPEYLESNRVFNDDLNVSKLKYILEETRKDFGKYHSVHNNIKHYFRRVLPREINQLKN